MKYHFDEIICRKNTCSIKYDFAEEYGLPEDVLPLWVADMDFPAPPDVLDDVKKAVEHGIFGYTEARSRYYEALQGWFTPRFGISFEAKDVVKVPGVVFALAQAVLAFTQPGDCVLIQPPVYPPFYSVVSKNGRILAKNPLIYENGAYSIDFVDFESKIISENVKMFILCSPHNPVGRVWTHEELEKLNDICQRHGVIVVSDEIHCDFIREGHVHTSFAMIDQNAVIATAPSKTFNLAGLQAANVIVKNPELCRKLKEAIDRSGYSQLNTLGLIACQSAYEKGGEWLGQLNAYLAQNIDFVKGFLEENLPKVRMVDAQGTYLLWLDFSAYGLPQKELDRKITHEAKLWLNSGTLFGSEGEGFQRINIACPKEILQIALERLQRVFG
ncbi:MAG: MalY/PatB family protein [Christensenellales bacterium]